MKFFGFPACQTHKHLYRANPKNSCLCFFCNKVPHVLFPQPPGHLEAMERVINLSRPSLFRSSKLIWRPKSQEIQV